MRIFVILFFCFAFMQASAQNVDTLFTTKAKVIPCKYMGEDSAKIYVVITKHGNKINSQLSKSKVLEMRITPSDRITPVFNDKFSLGPGLGFDYGGYGINLVIYPQKNVGLFGGFGYVYTGPGYNFGLRYRYFNGNPLTRLAPFVTVMYGLHAAIFIRDAEMYNKNYYGVTLGTGLDFKIKPRSIGNWSLGVMIPIKRKAAYRYIEWLEDKGAKKESGLSPIGISLGYKFKIG